MKTSLLLIIVSISEIIVNISASSGVVSKPLSTNLGEPSLTKLADVIYCYCTATFLDSESNELEVLTAYSDEEPEYKKYDYSTESLHSYMEFDGKKHSVGQKGTRVTNWLEGEGIQIIDVVSKKLIQMVPFKEELWCSVEFNPDQSKVAFYSPDSLYVYDLLAEEMVVKQPATFVYCVHVFSSEGDRIYYNSGKDSAEAYSLSEKKIVETYPLVPWSVSLSPDGSTLAIASAKVFALWDIESGRQLNEWYQTEENWLPFRHCQFLSDGKRLVMVTTRELMIIDASEGAILERHDSISFGVEIRKDEKALVTTGSNPAIWSMDPDFEFTQNLNNNGEKITFNMLTFLLVTFLVYLGV